MRNDSWVRNGSPAQTNKFDQKHALMSHNKINTLPTEIIKKIEFLFKTVMVLK